jgi:precorrin-8X/cobalt-precorrin-8 methylmutase
VTWQGGLSGLSGNDEANADGLAPEELQVMRSRVDLAAFPPITRAVTERIIGSSAELCYAKDLVCSEPWLEAAVSALAGGAPLVADGPMVAAGLPDEVAICKARESLTERLARTAGIARAAAAVRLAFGQAGPGAVWVVGSEPVAIYEILSRNTEPALVIGLPAGFVAALAAKKLLIQSGVPALTNVCEKGGPAVAVAACHALLAAAWPPGQQIASSSAARFAHCRR